MAIATPLYSLPNEILLQILTPLTSRTLLSLAAVSLRFHDIVLRILHYRLLLASSLEDYKLILECFHPVAKLIHPHLFCTYLGTPGLTENHEGKGSLYEGCGTSECLARLSGLYSCFRPEVDDARQANDNDDGDDWNGKGQRESPLLPKKQISLDEYEDFSQLCAVVNLVKVVPSSMRLVSAVTVEDGVLRIWRDWLKRQSKKENMKENMNNNYYEDNRRNNENDNNDSSILWLDLKKTVGLKLRVKEKKWRQQEMPVLMHGDEEPAVSYEVEIEEIRIRTTHLLLTVEQSLAEQNVNSNAIIIGYGHIFENVVYTLVH